MEITRKYDRSKRSSTVFCPIFSQQNFLVMKKMVITYGLLSGAVGAVLMLCLALYMGTDFDSAASSHLVGYAGILLSMLFVFFGVRAYRDQAAAGVISFGKAFQVGLLITLISCAIYVLAWMIVSNTLMSDFMDKYVAYTLEKLRSSGASEAVISEKTAEMEHFKELYKNPLFRIGITFLEPFPVGLAVTLLTAAVLRRGRP